MHPIVAALLAGLSTYVMIAASFGLLNEAEDVADQINLVKVIPVSVGLVLGALVMFLLDIFLMHRFTDHHTVSLPSSCARKSASLISEDTNPDDPASSPRLDDEHENDSKQGHSFDFETRDVPYSAGKLTSRRICILLVTAITLHNIPEGLAVGMVLAGVENQSVKISAAMALVIGIGLHNVPEGLAVVFPLIQAGYKPYQAFLFCQLSAVVEPLFAVIGAASVGFLSKTVPFGLCFACGAMMYVVVDELIPLSRESGTKHLSTIGTMTGFIGMSVISNVVDLIAGV